MRGFAVRWTSSGRLDIAAVHRSPLITPDRRVARPSRQQTTLPRSPMKATLDKIKQALPGGEPSALGSSVCSLSSFPLRRVRLHHF